VLELEPEPHGQLNPPAIDEMFLALADFIDIKSPFTSGHSRAVAELAAGAAREFGLPDSDVAKLRRAGLVHDLGQVGVSTAILVKPGPLSESEWEKVRLHPYHAERILGGPALFAELAPLAGSHHERLDGSGYHRGARGDVLSPLAKILAAAEAYRSMIEPRSHRPALSPQAAAGAMQQAVRAGTIDGESARAVLGAAGHRVTAVRYTQIAGLTPREVEVLRLIAGGQSIKEIARTLGVASKTADNHIQNLYAKIGVKTRGGATLFALEHGLFARQ
jgi:HD-GYP domain-containing protein (c-di-GMP phosphodiesterase class II)